MNSSLQRACQPLLGPWPAQDPELAQTNAGLHVVARAAGLGLVGGALIGIALLPALLLVTW